jgi:DNA-binding response OmpR family regulator
MNFSPGDRMTNEHRRRLIAAIDDDGDMLELVKLTLSRGGFEVISTSNPQKAVSMVEENQPLLVLLDLMMPQMDGWQVFEALKANDATKAIPIVLMTAKNSSVDRLLGLQIAHAADYLNKPFAPDELLSTIKRLLSV